MGEGHKGQFNFRAGLSSALKANDLNRDFTFLYVVVTDDDWDKFMQTSDCSEQLSLAQIQGYVQFKGDGYWSTVDTHTFVNKYRTSIFYVAATN